MRRRSIRHAQAGTFGECNIGFFECIEDYAVAKALLERASAWTREHQLVRMIGTYNLDRGGIARHPDRGARPPGSGLLRL